MINEGRIKDTLEDLFGKIEFPKEPKGLYDPLRYIMGLGGKRLRPALCLLTWSMYKDSFDNDILQAAAALEVFHNFTLIHDDVMDNAPTRRGKETVWKKWGNDTAILSGDVMCIESYRRLAGLSPAVLPAALKLFNAMTAGICEGQQLDMDFEALPKVSMEDYMKMTGLKTALLLATSARMGALVAGAPTYDCDLLYNFGYDLGLAFQIADDYLDSFGDRNTFGKEIGGDILEGKKTWLLVRALSKDEKTVQEALSMPTGTPELNKAKIVRFTELYRSLGVDEDARCEMGRLHSSALGHSEKIGLSKVKTEMLARYAGKLLGRNK